MQKCGVDRFQEFDLSTEAMLYYSTFREDLWRTAIESSFGKDRHLYTKVLPFSSSLPLVPRLLTILFSVQSFTPNNSSGP